MKLGVISSSLDDDRIQRLDENTWQCLWCNKTFQVINDTNYIAHVLGEKSMQINYYSDNIKASISSF